MLADIIWFAAAAAVSLGFVWATYLLIDRLLRKLLDDLLGMAAATELYSRLLLVSLVLVGLGGINEADFGDTDGMAPMEFVWHIVEYIDDMLGWVLTILGLLMAAVTVLIATLRRRNEQ